MSSNSEKDPKLLACAFADDLNYAGSVVKIRSCWKTMEVGQNFGSFPQPTKTILIVQLTFRDVNAKTTSAEQRHLQPFKKYIDTFPSFFRASVHHK